MEKVSILVPVYGVEKYIKQCARSLFEQTYKNIEYIFVDDCSKDNSISILKETALDYPERKEQIKIIRHSENKGLGGARLTALKNASGEYVTHVDSDDFLPKDAISILVEKAEESGADLTDGGYAEWENGQTVKILKAPHYRKEKYLKAMLCQNIVSNRIWGRLYKREMLMKYEVFSVEGIDFSEDYAVVPRAMLHSKLAYTDDTIYYYRKDNSCSYTHTASEKHVISHIKACQLVAEYIRNSEEGNRYGTAVDLGIVNAYRCLRDNGFDIRRAEEILTYKPKDKVCRMLIGLLKKGAARKTVDIPYLIYRKLYIMLG